MNTESPGICRSLGTCFNLCKYEGFYDILLYTWWSIRISPFVLCAITNPNKYIVQRSWTKVPIIDPQLRLMFMRVRNRLEPPRPSRKAKGSWPGTFPPQSSLSQWNQGGMESLVFPIITTVGWGQFFETWYVRVTACFHEELSGLDVQ